MLSLSAISLHLGDCIQSIVGVFVRERKREIEREGGEREREERERERGEEAGHSLHSSGENKESVFCLHRWRQCGGWSNHRFAKHLKHLGQIKPPGTFL